MYIKKSCLFLLLVFFVNANYCVAQKLSKKERKEFTKKCKLLAQTFCGYIEELTEENSYNQNMTVDEFFNSEDCQFSISQMKSFFSKENLASKKNIGYTPTGKPPVVYTSIDKYIRLLLNQRRRYRTVQYEFSAFVITDLIEKTDKNGMIYYEAEVKFKQNFLASKKHKGNSETGWNVFHEDYKKLTFKIKPITTKDGKYYAITFHKLEVDLQEYK